MKITALGRPQICTPPRPLPAHTPAQTRPYQADHSLRVRRCDCPWGHMLPGEATLGLSKVPSVQNTYNDTHKHERLSAHSHASETCVSRPQLVTCTQALFNDSHAVLISLQFPYANQHPHHQTPRRYRAGSAALMVREGHIRYQNLLQGCCSISTACSLLCDY